MAYISSGGGRKRSVSTALETRRASYTPRPPAEPAQSM